jgi:hypothetical protein
MLKNCCVTYVSEQVLSMSPVYTVFDLGEGWEGGGFFGQIRSACLKYEFLNPENQ